MLDLARIVGRGLVAQTVAQVGASGREVFFAAGVASSLRQNDAAYAREMALLHQTLIECEREGTRLVYFSSAGKIYGDTDELRDELTPCKPCTAYGKHKLACEQLIKDHTCDHLILRLSNLVGITSNAEQLIPALMLQAASGAMTIQRHAYRDLVGADFLIDVLPELLASAGSRETVVVASGTSVSCQQIAKRIMQLMAVTANIKQIAGGTVERFNITRLKQLSPLAAQLTESEPVRILAKYVPELACATQSVKVI